MMKKCLFVLNIFIFSHAANGQVAKNSELFLALKQQDSIFFERCFNLCDFEFLNKSIHKDLVFYHDQGGIQDRAVFIENTKKYICGDTIKKPIRKVVVESLEVFPLYDQGVLYGAIQSGIHNFYIREKNKADIPTSTAKFIHLYLLENGNWLLKEVMSFDHHEQGK